MCLFATFHIVYFYQQGMKCIIKINVWNNRQHALQQPHDVKMKQNNTIAAYSKPAVLEFDSNSNTYFAILKHHFQNGDKNIYLKQLILSLHFCICKAASLLLIQNIFLLYESTTFPSGDVPRMLISGFSTSLKRKDIVYSHFCINWFQVLVS